MELTIKREMGCQHETLQGDFKIHESAQFYGNDIDKAQRVLQGLCGEMNRLLDEDVGIFLDKILVVIYQSQYGPEEESNGRTD